MGKFRNFLINEEMGLADLGTNIDALFQSQHFANQVNGAFMPSHATGNELSPTMGYSGSSSDLTTGITIPSIEKTGRITCLLLKKNPIYVKLSDGTEAFFTFDEWKRIEGEPAIGKNMTIVFQRHPNDWSRNASKIDKAIVHS